MEGNPRKPGMAPLFVEIIYFFLEGTIGPDLMVLMGQEIGEGQTPGPGPEHCDLHARKGKGDIALGKERTSGKSPCKWLVPKQNNAMGKIQNFVRKYGLHLLAGATFVCLLAAILIYFIPDMYRGAKMVMTWIYNPMTGITTPQYIFNVATWCGYEIAARI